MHTLLNKSGNEEREREETYGTRKHKNKEGRETSSGSQLIDWLIIGFCFLSFLYFFSFVFDTSNLFSGQTQTSYTISDPLSSSVRDEKLVLSIPSPYPVPVPNETFLLI